MIIHNEDKPKMNGGLCLTARLRLAVKRANIDDWLTVDRCWAGNSGRGCASFARTITVSSPKYGQLPLRLRIDVNAPAYLRTTVTFSADIPLNIYDRTDGFRGVRPVNATCRRIYHHMFCEVAGDVVSKYRSKRKVVTAYDVAYNELRDVVKLVDVNQIYEMLAAIKGILVNDFRGETHLIHDFMFKDGVV